MKLALMTFGSAGDVHPMLALGQALQRRGHEVVLLSLPVFEAQAVAAGLRFVPVGRTEDYEQTLAHPKLWHAVDGLGVMWRYLLRPVMQPAYEALTRLVHEGVDALVAPPFVLAARVASERWGTPLLSVYTAATMLRSTRWPVTVAAWRVPAGVPSWAVAGLWRGARGASHRRGRGGAARTRARRRTPPGPARPSARSSSSWTSATARRAAT